MLNLKGVVRRVKVFEGLAGEVFKIKGLNTAPKVASARYTEYRGMRVFASLLIFDLLVFALLFHPQQIELIQRLFYGKVFIGS